VNGWVYLAFTNFMLLVFKAMSLAPKLAVREYVNAPVTTPFIIVLSSVSSLVFLKYSKSGKGKRRDE
jgi:hypothetical protein